MKCFLQWLASPRNYLHSIYAFYCSIFYRIAEVYFKMPAWLYCNKRVFQGVTYSSVLGYSCVNDIFYSVFAKLLHLPIFNEYSNGLLMLTGMNLIKPSYFEIIYLTASHWIS